MAHTNTSLIFFNDDAAGLKQAVDSANVWPMFGQCLAQLIHCISQKVGLGMHAE